jgi:hypothetical protein
MAGLNGRLTRLERLRPPALAVSWCRGCDLPHVPTKWTIADVRSLFGVYRPGHPEYRELGPLCLCACCERGRGLAELTHH